MRTPKCAKLVQRRERRFGLGEKHGFGDLELEPLGGEAGVSERADHGVDEIERSELDRRQIDRDRHPVRPRRGFGAGGPEHPFADRDDQAGRFGDGMKSQGGIIRWLGWRQRRSASKPVTRLPEMSTSG